MGECGWVDIFYCWVRVVGGIFWVGGGVWTFFMSRWGWVEVGRGIYWVVGGWWRCILGGWGCVDILLIHINFLIR